MSGAHEPRRVLHRRAEPGARGAHVRRVGFDEARVIEPAADERHVHVGALRAQLAARGGDVLTVLLAARIGVLRRGDEPDGAPDTGRVHLAQRVRQDGMPVAHARRRPAAADRRRVRRASRPAACRFVMAVMGDTPPKSS